MRKESLRWRACLAFVQVLLPAHDSGLVQRRAGGELRPAALQQPRHVALRQPAPVDDQRDQQPQHLQLERPAAHVLVRAHACEQACDFRAKVAENRQGEQDRDEPPQPEVPTEVIHSFSCSSRQVSGNCTGLGSMRLRNTV